MFRLLRKRKDSDKWTRTSIGNLPFILETLQLHLENEELVDYEWRVQPCWEVSV